jgi:hypothetical protein
MNSQTIKATHHASVTAILGSGTRPVRSQGVQFYNRDRWTGRVLLDEISKDLTRNGGGPLTRDRIAKWVRAANNQSVSDPSITIADTPDNLNDRMIGALIGGAYHEAWHTKYSCTRNLTVDEVERLLRSRWGKISDWMNFAKLILDWSNVIEDIRIERLGGKVYPGTHTKMCDLQDFILDLEAKGDTEARAHGIQTGGALSTITKTFRDLGLGYPTNRQQAALDAYKRDNQQAVDFVTKGALAPLLKETIETSAVCALPSTS